MRTRVSAGVSFIHGRSLWPSIALLFAIKTFAQSDSAVTLVSALVKIRPDRLPVGKREATILAARGECEAIQVLVRPPARRVNAKLENLSGPGKALAGHTYREEYMWVSQASTAAGATGLWPDRDRG